MINPIVAAEDDRWFTAGELAGIPGLPGTERGVTKAAARGSLVRRKRARGKGWEYAWSSLPVEAQAALTKRLALLQRPAEEADASEACRYDPGQLAEVFDRKAEKTKRIAEEKLRLFLAAEDLVSAGWARTAALQAVAQGSPWSWARLRDIYHGRPGRDGLKHFARQHWLYVLAGAHVGRLATRECSPEAWEQFKALYLDRQQRCLSECWRWVRDAAAEHGWQWPPQRTIRDRVRREIRRDELVLLREGPDAFARLIPAQQRDRSVFHALEAVNGDGVEFHRYCRWPSGEVARPKVWVWQDLYSGLVLAYRADVSENGDLFRLAFGDLIRDWGIPQAVYIDNTMAAACKQNTGGARNRFRFRIRDDDPIGLLPSLGVDVRFTKPAHGQSKPIERGFRTLRQTMDTHPRFGAQGTKGNPLLIDDFLAVLREEITRHNAEPGRRTPVCQGRSYREVFDASYAAHSDRIPRPTEEQVRRCLLAAERVRSNSESGAVALGQGPHGPNLYWAKELARHAGRQLMVRFDPDDLHQQIHIYSLDGRYLCAAECTWRAGFSDTGAGRAYARWRKRHTKATRDAAEAHRRMRSAAAAGLLARAPADPGPPDTPVRRGQFGVVARGRTAAPEVRPDGDADDLYEDRFGSVVSAALAAQPPKPRMD